MAISDDCLTTSIFKALCHNFKEFAIILIRFQEVTMIVEASYAQTMPNLNVLLDRVVNDREIIYIKSQNGENVALIAADELQSLLETMHLLRSPKNAERLLNAISRARANVEDSQTPDDLRKELGLVKE
jgi:antitoxin YefM